MPGHICWPHSALVTPLTLAGHQQSSSFNPLTGSNCPITKVSFKPRITDADKRVTMGAQGSTWSGHQRNGGDQAHSPGFYPAWSLLASGQLECLCRGLQFVAACLQAGSGARQRSLLPALATVGPYSSAYQLLPLTHPALPKGLSYPMSVVGRGQRNRNKAPEPQTITAKDT